MWKLLLGTRYYSASSYCNHFLNSNTCQMTKIIQFSDKFNVLYWRESSPWVTERSASEGGALFPRDFGQREFYTALEGLSQWLSSKESACHAGDIGDMSWSLNQEDHLEEEMATLFRILAWKILWTEEPGRLQSKRSQRIRQDWTTKRSEKVTPKYSLIA